MRASQKVKSQDSKRKIKELKIKIQNSKLKEIHISGAEGLYLKTEFNKIVSRYIERALNHPKGIADKIVLTIEKIEQKPYSIRSLPVSTVYSRTPLEGKRIIEKITQTLGISKMAFQVAIKIIKEGNMRGATLISAEKAKRLEPDLKRGIRVSRLGITNSALKRLSTELSRYSINTETVKEAIILASKVSSSKGVVAELCISDDPDYTTGYLASQRYGYVRIPHIKKKGSKRGGRAFFIKEGVNIEKVTRYLEEIPVIITRVSTIKGVLPLNEIINSYHK